MEADEDLFKRSKSHSLASKLANKHTSLVLLVPKEVKVIYQLKPFTV